MRLRSPALAVVLALWGVPARAAVKVVRVIALPDGAAYATGVAARAGRVYAGAGYDGARAPLAGRLFAIDPDGTAPWSRVSPALCAVFGVDGADVDGDGRVEVLAGFGKGPDTGAELLDADGAPRWRVLLPSNAYVRSVRLGELRPGLRGLEAVAAGNNGEVVLLDAAGRTLWRRVIGPLVNTQCARIADLDRDGRNEILLAGGWGRFGTVRVLTAGGGERWRASVGEDSMGVAAADLLPGCAGLEIAVVSAKRDRAAWANKVTLLRSDGRPIWSVPWPTNPWAVTTADLDRDGRPEIYVGYGSHDVAPPGPGDSGGVAALSKSGAVLFDLGLPSSVKMIERSAEGTEVLASCDDGRVYVLADGGTGR